MMVGDVPFNIDTNEVERHRMMLTTQDVLYPDTIYSTQEEDWPTEREFLEALLKKNPEERLGCFPGQEEDIKSHNFFQTIDWVKLENLEVEPPFKPVIFWTC